jgi:hypothetical protein
MNLDEWDKKDIMENSEHLQWIHDRCIEVYKESENVDFLIRMREIIKEIKGNEDSFDNYMKYVVERRKNK